MFQLIIKMWNSLLYRLGYERKAAEKRAFDPNVQRYGDIDHTNWLAMAVSKIANLACTETTLEVKTDSAVAEPLVSLCEDIEAKRFDIVSGMLGSGDSYIFPAFDERGNLYHSLLDESRVIIADSDGGNITKAYAVLDTYKPDKCGRVFFLVRIHELNENGSLTISYDTVDESGQSVFTERWQNLKGQVTRFDGANHIGFGRYKSPVPSRGHSDIYGVPLNFSCGDIERQIAETMRQIEDEFENGKSKIFTDPRNLQVAKNKNGEDEYQIIDNIIPIKKMAGDSGSQIDIFNPTLRGSEHFEKLKQQLAIYERQMGLSQGILTENEAMATGTATAVRRSNSDTIAFINAVQASLDRGNIMTLEADAVFLNIRRDLWEYNSDYYDVFADSSEQWNMLITAFDKGAVSVERVTKWLNPQMTDEQIAEELEKVNGRKAEDTQSAILAALEQ